MREVKIRYCGDCCTTTVCCISARRIRRDAYLEWYDFGCVDNRDQLGRSGSTRFR